MRRAEKMEYILNIISNTENGTKTDVYKSCLEHNIVESKEEFEAAFEKLIKKGCVTIHPETKAVLFKRPYSYLRQKGSIKYNGTKDRIFYLAPSNQPLGRM